MNDSLYTFMKLVMTIVVLSGLVIGTAYEALKNTNNDYHQKINQYQIKEK